MLRSSLVSIPDRFAEYLQDYCEQAKDAIKHNKHHDQRRAFHGFYSQGVRGFSR